MKTQRIAPARIDFVDGQAHAPDYGDRYHARAGAPGQARHVFLGGNGLPGRWQRARRFAILETGFGLGNNFVATWAAWRDDPARCERLDYVALELHPPRRADLARALGDSGVDPAQADALCQAWPPAMPGIHHLAFEDGRVMLWLALGDARALVPALVGRFDAFYLDGFAPDRNPAMWDRRLLQALGRLAAPGATAATWSVAQPVRHGLAQAGFTVDKRPGYAGKRQMCVARHEPRLRLPTLPGRPDFASRCADTEGTARQAVVVGAGLAGAAVAHALAQRGWACTVLDRAAEPASGASGNPAGLFHGTLHDEDGAHARLHRAGALMAARAYRALVDAGVPGAVEGLVTRRQAGRAREVPPEYAFDGSADEASIWAGVGLDGPATLYPEGGWVSPRAVVGAWLATPGIAFRGGVDVCTLRQRQPGPAAIGQGGAEGSAQPGADRRAAGWDLLDARGQIVASAPVVVLAGGTGLPAITVHDGTAAPHGRAPGPAPALPWQTVRGQANWFAAQPRLNRPVTGHGYALQLPDGRLLCGATAHHGDTEAALRAADTAFNLERLRALTGLEPGPGAEVSGRVGWRLGTTDRLPVIGPVPDAEAAARGRRDQARLVPRRPGLFIAGGFGARGLNWAPLAGELIAAWLDGTPLPLTSDLLDAIDPARGLVRQARRSASSEEAS